MTTNLNPKALKALKNAILLCLLASTTACVSSQSAPTMLDYSYVPPNHTSVTPGYGIDDF